MLPADVNRCPDCGALWDETATCETYFHQLLFRETEAPSRWVVHHLTVLCYHLQHPHLYSPEAVAWGKGALVDFLERGISPQQVRQREREAVDSGRRTHKITGTPDHHGAYRQPVPWTLTAADVVAAGADAYIDSVQRWAESCLAALRAAGEIA